MTPDQLRSITVDQSPPLVPEIKVPALPHHQSLESFRSQHQHIIGAATPYWLVAWPGGQGLARYLLDTPRLVSERRVIDLGCGNGLVAVAAAVAGAHSVLAIDIDANALVCAGETARLNKVSIRTDCGDLRDYQPEPGDLVCAADLWYERAAGRLATGCLARLKQASCTVLFCDAGRSFRPRSDVVCLETYRLPVSLEFESSATLSLRICTLETVSIRPAHTGHVPQN